jgi:hypothetical protein
MKKVLSIAVAAVFTAASFGALAQDKKKDEVKAKQGGQLKSAGGAAVTTADQKKKDNKGVALPTPTPEGKRKTEAQRTEKK